MKQADYQCVTAIDDKLTEQQNRPTFGDIVKIGVAVVGIFTGGSSILGDLAKY